jgi:hypothetical protein
MWLPVGLVRTDFSKESVFTIFKVEIIRTLGTLAVTRNLVVSFDQNNVGLCPFSVVYLIYL